MSRTCPVCRHAMQTTRIRHVQTWHDQVVVFDHVPAEVCDHCGEILLAGWVVDKLNSILWSKAPAAETIQAPVYDLSDLPVA
jgi:YgiT-type zinc finger domain-containing protein